MANIAQTITFSAPPQEVYELLVNEKAFAKLTNAKAKIDNRVGGKFSVWDEYATGTFLELLPGKKITQTWRASDWPAGLESKVTYVFSAKIDGCELRFSQSDVPDEFASDISQGWDDYYWSLMKQYLAEQK